MTCELRENSYETKYSYRMGFFFFIKKLEEPLLINRKRKNAICNTIQVPELGAG